MFINAIETNTLYYIIVIFFFLKVHICNKNNIYQICNSLSIMAN